MQRAGPKFSPEEINVCDAYVKLELNTQTRLGEGLTVGELCT